MFTYFVLISLYFVFSNSVMDYGEYDLALTKVETCKGPKRKNCSDFTVKIVDGTYLKYDLVVKENIGHIKGKMIGMVNDKQLLKLKIRNLCEHIFFKPLVMSILNVTPACEIVKGHYNFSMDIQAVSRKFYGNMFMFGNWSVMEVLHNDVCNFICGVVHMSLTPKSSKNKRN